MSLSMIVKRIESMDPIWSPAPAASMMRSMYSLASVNASSINVMDKLKVSALAGTVILVPVAEMLGLKLASVPTINPAPAL